MLKQNINFKDKLSSIPTAGLGSTKQLKQKHNGLEILSRTSVVKHLHTRATIWKADVFHKLSKQKLKGLKCDSNCLFVTFCYMPQTLNCNNYGVEMMTCHYILETKTTHFLTFQYLHLMFRRWPQYQDLIWNTSKDLWNLIWEFDVKLFITLPQSSPISINKETEHFLCGKFPLPKAFETLLHIHSSTMQCCIQILPCRPQT